MANRPNVYDGAADGGEPGGRSLSALLKDFADGSAQLIRHEVRLARTEAAELGKHLGSGAAEVAAGGVLAFIGALAFVVGLIMLVGDQLLRDHYWVAALIITVIAGVVAAILAKRGLALLSPRHLVPEQTVATLQEDVEWLKRQRT